MVAPVPTTPVRQRGGNVLVTIGGVTLGVLALSLFSGTHLIFALIAIPVVVAMAWSNPIAAIGVLPVWMVAMGMIRRLTPGGGNVTFSGDPVLIVGPIALLVMWALVVTSRQSGRMSPLARWVMIFDVLAVLEAFNPKQGSLLTGIGGLLFVFVPTTAFWIGRRYADPVFMLRIVWTVAIMGLVAALYGLYQQFVGFPPWDVTYINTKGYLALNVGGGVIRAFSSFSSAQEYAVFLSVSTVAWVALLARRTRWPLIFHLAALGTVVTALFYEAQRTSFFLMFLAVGVMGASRLRLRPFSVMVAGAASVIVLIALAGALHSTGGGSSSLNPTQSVGGVLSNRQLGGIADPTGKGSSLNGHIKATRQGIMAGFKHPLGRGTGSINLASQRYNPKHQRNNGTEFDPGNMGIAFGLPGLIVYAVLAFFALSTAYRFAIRRRDAVGIFVIGIMAASLFQWTNGDLYSVCWLVWLSLGMADRLLDTPIDEGELAPLKAGGDSSFTWRRPGDPRRAISRQ